MTAKLYQFQSTASGCLIYVAVGDKEVKFDFSNGHCAIVLSPEELEAAKLNKSYGRAFALAGELKNPASGHAVQVIVAKGANPVAPVSADAAPDLSEAEEIEDGKEEIARTQQFLAKQESEEKAKAVEVKKSRKK